ncbi:MAG TPA: ROK family protein [Terriglobia bacterium]|nr:ROK family protein [Terriglobia bacterium]
MQKLIIGVDVGGTKVAGGLVTPKGRLVKSLIVPARAQAGFETSFRQVLHVIERLIHHARGRENVAGIGICVPGPLNPETGTVLKAPNLPGWNRIPVRRKLEKRFEIAAKVENDANAAGLGEVLFGAARGFRHVFYVTVSTGIGTGIIINRRIYHGKNGAAGEGGHVSIDFQSHYRCGCGALGHIETLASGPAMARRARVRLEQEAFTPSLLRRWTQGNLSRITPQMIEKAARAGDRAAKIIVDETGFYLGVWLAGMITLLDPEAIVIGGGVAQIGKPLFAKIRETIQRYTLNPQLAAKTPLLPAKLEKLVGVYGAASLFLPAGIEAEKNY